MHRKPRRRLRLHASDSAFHHSPSAHGIVRWRMMDRISGGKMSSTPALSEQAPGLRSNLHLTNFGD